MKHFTIRKVVKLTLMVALAKHGVLSVGKSKDKHIEVSSYRSRTKSTIALVV